jgi:ABC-type multidrug transport system ATPase subunit
MEALLAYYTDGRQTATLPLPRQPVTLGSSREDLLPLREPGIQPRHVGLRWQPSQATWEMARLMPESTVEVNGRNLQQGEWLPLDHLDELRIGRTMFRFLKKPAEPKYKGVVCPLVELEENSVVLGRESMGSAGTLDLPGLARVDLDGEDSGISRTHAQLIREGGTWIIEDRSKTGTELNGQAFTRKPLVPGDRFRIRDYFFEFNGSALIRVDQASGGRIEAHNVDIRVPQGEGQKTILSGVSLDIRSGEFVGLLGGSGMGKSTLLRALCGLMPVTSGTITIDGEPVQTAAVSAGLGFVPQDDIVHHELTVRDALLFSARLRLRAPVSVLETLVDGTIQRLNLTAQKHQRIASLSGGQRKRVNIATELLTRPPVLLLDEPSSGLDPANEEELMTLLQNLRLTGQTVVCSTHVLHKAYLFDRICFIHSGQLMFMGSSSDALRFFLDDEETGDAAAMRAPLEKIYALFTQHAEETVVWRRKFEGSPLAPGRAGAPPPVRMVPNRNSAGARPGWITLLQVLLARQWAILRSDRLNLVFLAAQAGVIGVLAGWVGRSQPEFRLFLMVIATLWFGCNNAAQQLTREVPVFRRERVSGLGLHTYLLSKWKFLSAITLVQCALMLACMAAVLGVSAAIGSSPQTEWANVTPTGWALHAAAFALTSLTGVGIGLAISSLARSSTQAAIWVPLVLIPQILFAGFVVPLADMPASVRIFSHAVPSASSQRLIDLGHIIGKPLPAITHNTRKPLFWDSAETDSGWKPKFISISTPAGSHDDIAELNPLNRAWQNLAVQHSQIGTAAPKKPDDGSVHVNEHPLVNGKSGDQFRDFSSAWISLGALGAWLAAAYVIIAIGLKRRDPLRLARG